MSTLRSSLIFTLGLVATAVGSSSTSHADFLSLGLGGKYGQFTLPNDSSSTDSIYRGLGYRGELRFRFAKTNAANALLLGGGASAQPFGFDIFGVYEGGSAKNVSTAQDERLDYQSIGLGFDTRIHAFYLGFEYRRSTDSLVNATLNRTIQFAYWHPIARAGVTVGLGTSVQIMAGGYYSFGAALPRDNAALTSTQMITEFGGTLLLHIKLLSNEAFSIYQGQ